MLMLVIFHVSQLSIFVDYGNLYYRFDRIRIIPIIDVQKTDCWTANYSEKFPKITGCKRNICFRNALPNLGNILLSDVSEDKGFVRNLEDVS